MRLLGNPLICSWSCVWRFSEAGPDGSGASLLRVVAEKAGEWGLSVVPALKKEVNTNKEEQQHASL